jgi:hypothetical protein
VFAEILLAATMGVATTMASANRTFPQRNMRPPTPPDGEAKSRTGIAALIKINAARLEPAVAS